VRVAWIASIEGWPRQDEIHQVAVLIDAPPLRPAVSDDRVCATIGRAVLGERHDVSYYKP
jgi:hypothetical protein